MRSLIEPHVFHASLSQKRLEMSFSLPAIDRHGLQPLRVAVRAHLVDLDDADRMSAHCPAPRRVAAARPGGCRGKMDPEKQNPPRWFTGRACFDRSVGKASLTCPSPAVPGHQSRYAKRLGALPRLDQ